MVSIIVPVYNSSRYLDKCIDSLINQTYQDIEIILVDDGSSDDSLQICKKYAESDMRVKVFHKENGGVSTARNYGLEVCKGELICFADSDDYADIMMVEKMVEIINKYNAEMGIFGYYVKSGGILREFNVTEEDRLVNIEIDPEEIIHLSLNSVINPPYCKIYKRALLLEKHIRFDEESSLGEDFIFNMDYISNIKKLVLGVDKIYYYKSDNVGSLTNKIRDDLLNEELKMYHKFVDVMEQYRVQMASGRIQEYILLVVRIYLSNYFLQEKNKKKRIQAIRNALVNEEIRNAIKIARPKNRLNCILCFIMRLRFIHGIYGFFGLKLMVMTKKGLA